MNKFCFSTWKKLKKSNYKLLLGDCLNYLKNIEDNFVDVIITDPPAGISFVGKDWDSDKGGRDYWIQWMGEIAKECLRVIKPGGHALVWALPRTSHWTATAWENGGFEVRDRLAHFFGTGFPKNHNISKAIDKVNGKKGIVVSEKKTNSGGYAHISKTNVEQGFRPRAYKGHSTEDSAANVIQVVKPESSDAKKWEGWGTALKPSMEDWWLFRKPPEGTIAKNVIKYGTGGLNIDACRIGEGSDKIQGGCSGKIVSEVYKGGIVNRTKVDTSVGRWPSQIIHDGSEEVLHNFPNYDKPFKSPSRFFYCAKASPAERKNNKHPTIKAVALMEYLVTLVSAENHVVLDPFMGSGSTGVVCVKMGRKFIGIEKEEEYFEIAQRRLKDVI